MTQRRQCLSDAFDFDKSDYRILVAESSKAINMIVYDSLRAEGYQCAQAFTFRDAAEQLEASAFNLVILDPRLPDGDGEELIFTLKKSSDAKIVILATDDDKMLRDHLYQQGILEYFIKNEQILHTIAAIDQLIEKTECNRLNTILIIDDSPTVHKLLADILKPRNYSLCHAKNGAEALALLSENEPGIDLVLLDLELPDMNGLNILKMLKTDEKNILLPILVVSGTSDPAMISSSFKYGAFDFIQKPFITEEFVFKVDMWVDYTRRGHEIEQYHTSLEQRVAEEMEKRRKHEMMLAQQSRLAGMGEMIANIAHQWRQPLNMLSLIIVDLDTTYRFKNVNDAYMENMVDKANLIIEKMSSTIDDFSNFFHADKEKERFSLVDVTKETLNLVEALFKHNNISVVEKCEEAVYITGVKNEFSQVIINILNNARDALVYHNVESPTVTISCYREDGCACLSIADNAGGIPETIMDKIFDPYFTTRDAGTGIGLYMSKLIITEHMGGELSAENSDGGAVFTIKTPL